MDKICMVYITVKDRAEAEKIAMTLIKNKLAACANIIDDITSFYVWEGKDHQDKESLVLLKTIEKHLPEIEIQVKELHSYDCPCITAYPVVYASKDFAEWVIANTRD